MSHPILIVSHKEGRECDAVIDILQGNHCQVLRVNTCDFPEQSTISLFFPTTEAWVYVDAAKSKYLKDCQVGWLHHWAHPSTERSLTGLEREISISESEGSLMGLLLSLPCRWVNHPSKIWKTSHKAFQLHVAQEIGLRIPPTLISNDPCLVRSFAESHGGDLVAKNLHSGFLHFGGTNYKAYTRALNCQDFEELNTLRFGPCIFQGRIDKVKDIRITYVDGECFPAVVQSDDLPPEQVDIRTLDFEAHRSRFSIEPIQPNIISLCCKMASALQLRYAAFDFVENRRGEYFFLEINSLGSFMWVEKITGQKISEAIARCILRLAESHRPRPS